MKPNWEKHKKPLIARLSRIEGQVRALHKMIDKEDSCERVVQQMAAARKALDRAFFETISCALERELECGGSNSQIKERVSHLAELLGKYG